MWRLAFSISFLALFVACEDPGSVGGDFAGKTEIDIDTILVTSITSNSLDAYTGRLGRSPIGNFEDGLFGSIETYSFFKPSINRSSETFTLSDTTRLFLNLRFLDEEIYGDTSSTGTYSIYRVNPNSIWRGSSYKISDEVLFEEAELVGQFSDEDIDTSGFASFELSGTWKDDYIAFFNGEEETRDDVYRADDFGLAIVPATENSKIVYTSFALSNLSMIQEDTTSQTILDWGFDVERTGQVNDADRIVLQSTFENVLTINLAELADQLSNINFARAELVFSEDTLEIQSSLDENMVRTSPLGLGLMLGPLEDEAYDLGFGTLSTSAIKSNGNYSYNITNILNNYLFGETSINEAYLFLIANDGVLSYTSLYASGADPNLAPKIIIYGLGLEN